MFTQKYYTNFTKIKIVKVKSEFILILIFYFSKKNTENLHKNGKFTIKITRAIDCFNRVHK